HPYQSGGAAGPEIEPAQKLLATRLRRAMDLPRSLVGRGAAPRPNPRLQPAVIATQLGRQRPEKGKAWTRGQFPLMLQDLARERDPRCFTAAGEQLLAQFDQAGRTLFRAGAALARAIDQRTAALGNALQQFAEEGCIHGTNLSLRYDTR